MLGRPKKIKIENVLGTPDITEGSVNMKKPIEEIMTDFGREDMHLLREKINEIIRYIT